MIIFSLFILVFSSCGEEFISIDPVDFNNKIKTRTDITTPEELITLFYNYPSEEGRPNLSISVEDFGNNEYRVTLINDKMYDDSQSGEKVIMEASRKGKIWNVSKIRKNWKCYSERGHTNWGINPCY